MSKPSFRAQIAGLIGNLLEHYDNALFGLLAPFIAPLFFEKSDPITALILTYGIFPLGALTRPLGSLFFGWIGDRLGRRQALSYSLLGMALITVGIGSLPLYREIGIYAPILLALGRMLQSFFAAGESVGGAIFVLENTSSSKRSLMSSFYDVSSIGGVLIASGLVTLLSAQGSIETRWRFLFYLGGITALFGLFLRLGLQESLEFVKTKQESWIRILQKHKSALFSILLASGFSYTTYSLAFTLMNGYIPLITTLSKTEVMQVNTSLLVLDLLLLPCFGYLSKAFGKEKIMSLGLVFSIVGAIPLFSLLDHASLSLVVFVRLAIIVPGVAFAAPYYAWAIEQVPPQQRYMILSFGAALGSQFIGAPTSAICLWLYKTTAWSPVPGLYLMTVGLGASYALYRSLGRKQTELEKGL